MRQPFEGPHVLDLGEAWTRMTNLPFVWALWIGRNDLDSTLVSTLLRAKSFGIAHIEESAEFGAARKGFDYRVALRYLAEVIDYDLTEQHLEGLSLFANLCERHGFVSSAQLPKIVGEPSAI
jgi:chorismate dehydratase